MDDWPNGIPPWADQMVDDIVALHGQALPESDFAEKVMDTVRRALRGGDLL